MLLLCSTYWQRGWWNCCRSSEAASVKYSCFSNFRNPKIGISSNPQNLVNIPPEKWCMILHPKWLYYICHPPWTHWDSILVERDLLNATIWALSKEKCRLQWENQQQKRTDGRHQSYWPKVARVCVWLALGSFSASMMQKLGLLLRQNTI